MNLDNPKFSVIICTYNRPHADYIQRAIRSVMLQTFDDWQLLVINDGDTNNAIAYKRVIAPYADHVRVTYREERVNLGYPAARNVGIRETSGQYLLFLDDDDRLLPRALERLWSAIERHDYPDMVYGDAIYEDCSVRRLFLPPDKCSALRFPFSAKRLKETNYLISSAVAIARWRLLDGFAEDLWSGGLYGPEDWEMWLRIASAGGRIVGDPHTLLVRRADYLVGTPTEPVSARNQRTGVKQKGEAIVQARYANWEPSS